MTIPEKPTTINPVETNKGQVRNMSIIEYSEDLANAEAPAPLPAGTYAGEIVKAEPKTSQNGNPYVAITVTIPPEQYPVDFDAASAPDGVILTYNRLSTADNPSARYRMRKFLESVGLVPGRSVDLNDLLGCAVSVEVEQQTYEGELRATAKRVSGAS